MRWKYETYPRLLVIMERHLRQASYRATATRLETVYQSAHNEILAFKSLKKHINLLETTGVDPLKAPEANLIRDGDSVTHVSFTSMPFTAIYRLYPLTRTALMVEFDRKGDTVDEFGAPKYWVSLP